MDVAVLGAGIAGLTAALAEMGRVGTGVTGRSTAKITSQHELLYADLASWLGDAGARAYAEASQAALERIAAFVDECAFERLSNYVFTESEDYLPEMRREARVSAGLGLPASFVEETPFPVKGAVRFENQAQFDSYAYLLGLASEVQGDGSRVHEDTRALDVKDAEGGHPCTVETDRGTIVADDVVIVTHVPFPFHASPSEGEPGSREARKTGGTHRRPDAARRTGANERVEAPTETPAGPNRGKGPLPSRAMPYGRPPPFSSVVCGGLPA